MLVLGQLSEEGEISVQEVRRVEHLEDGCEAVVAVIVIVANPNACQCRIEKGAHMCFAKRLLREKLIHAKVTGDEVSGCNDDLVHSY